MAMRLITDCKTVEEFCRRYYKPDRFIGRGKDYAAACIYSHKEDCDKYGYTLLSRHDNITGEVIKFIPPRATRDEEEAEINHYLMNLASREEE